MLVFLYIDEEYIVQAATGSGGATTMMINKNNTFHNDIKPNSNYMVTKYCKNNIPINIHILISNNDIVLLPASIQIIEKIDNKLVYKGCDYIAYRKIKNILKNKHYNYTYIIANEIKNMGYRGICGIDSIIVDDEIYLMELNTRFQNSSTILNKALQEKQQPSLQELNIDCFKNKSITIKKFDVNYSCYISENTESEKIINIEPIDILDIPSKDIIIEDYAYKNSYIFNKSVVNQFRDVTL